MSAPPVAGWRPLEILRSKSWMEQKLAYGARSVSPRLMSAPLDRVCQLRGSNEQMPAALMVEFNNSIGLNFLITLGCPSAGSASALTRGTESVGKTATAERRATTIFRLDDPAQREVVAADPRVAVDAQPPVLIDEWQFDGRYGATLTVAQVGHSGGGAVCPRGTGCVRGSVSATAISSTSKMSSDFGGILGGRPNSP